MYLPQGQMLAQQICAAHLIQELDPAYGRYRCELNATILPVLTASRFQDWIIGDFPCYDVTPLR
jgi:hypothetical protein